MRITLAFLVFISYSSLSFSEVIQHQIINVWAVSLGYNVRITTTTYSVVSTSDGLYCQPFNSEIVNRFVPTVRPVYRSPTNVYYFNGTVDHVNDSCKSSPVNFAHTILHSSNSNTPFIPTGFDNISPPGRFLMALPPPEVLPDVTDDSPPNCVGYCSPCSPLYSPIRCSVFGSDPNDLGPIDADNAPELDVYQEPELPDILDDSPIPDLEPPDFEPPAPPEYEPPPPPPEYEPPPPPESEPPPPPESSDLGSLDVVNAVNSMSDNLASNLQALVSASDLANQTDQLSYALLNQTGQLSNDLSNLSNNITQKLDEQIYRSSRDTAQQTSDLSSVLLDGFRVSDYNDEVRTNKLNASLIALNNNLLGDGALTRDSLSAINASINGLDLGGEGGGSEIDLSGVESRLDTLSSSVDSGLFDSDGQSFLSKMFNFWGDDAGVDLLPDPSDSFTSSIESLGESERTELTTELTGMVEEFTFNSENYSFVGSTTAPVFSFIFKGKTITFDPWPMYMMASLVGIFIMVGSSILGLRIALGS